MENCFRAVFCQNPKALHKATLYISVMTSSIGFSGETYAGRDRGYLLTQADSAIFALYMGISGIEL